eukprot:791027-Rhodomonas_salina.1
MGDASLPHAVPASSVCTLVTAHMHVGHPQVFLRVGGRGELGRGGGEKRDVEKPTLREHCFSFHAPPVTKPSALSPSWRVVPRRRSHDRDGDPHLGTIILILASSS